MNWNEIKLRYPIGSHVEGFVQDIKTHRIDINIQAGVTGVVPHYEIEWHNQHHDQQEHFKLQMRISSLVFKHDDDNKRLILSLKRYKYDPWRDIGEEKLQHKIVKGVVFNHSNEYYFVEIIDGLPKKHFEAVLPKIDFMNMLKLYIKYKNPNFLQQEQLFIGDIIDAVVTKVDMNSHQLTLSVKKRMRQKDITSRKLQSLQDIKQISTMGESNPVLYWLRDNDFRLDDMQRDPENKQIFRVLFMYGNRNLLESFSDGLKMRGHKVEIATTIQELIQKVDSMEFDVVLLDYEFPLVNEKNFISLLLDNIPKTKVILFTEGHIADIEDFLEHETVYSIIPKPLSLDIIEEAMQLPKSNFLLNRGTRKKDVNNQKQKIKEKTIFNIDVEIEGLLTNLLNQINAESIILFHIDLNTKSISIDGIVPKFHLNNSSLDLCIYSPVYNVATEDEEIIVEDCSHHKSKLKYLLHLFNFGSCIGVPVRRYSWKEWALFAFGKNPYDLKFEHAGKVRSCAMLLQSALQAEIAWKSVVSNQKLAMLGQLSASYAHEIYNHVSILNQDPSALIDIISTKKNSLPDEMYQKGKMLEILARLNKSVDSLFKMSELLRQILVVDDTNSPVSTDINEIISSTTRLMQGFAEKCHILLETDLWPGNLIAKMRPEILLQVLCNLILNSIQQITERKSRLGHIKVCSMRIRNQEDPICIQVIDNGPGIHRAHWERIFDMMFTTRKKGCGLGLYISRQLLFPFGGNLFVESSILFHETIITISLKEL